MSTSGTSKQSDLRYWLAQEDWHMSEYTREWLARTPRDQAANTLIRIAEDAQPEPRSVLNQMAGGLAAAFATSENLVGGNISRRVGTRAALMLADLGDARRLPPLFRVFETSPTWQGKYQELVESALARFLSASVGQPQLRPYENEIRLLAERVWNTGSGAKELTEEHTTLLMAILQCLHALRGNANLAVLRSIASVPATKPNRMRVKDAARKWLNT